MIGSDSELECELQPIFTSVVWGVWDVCEMAINDGSAWLLESLWYVLMTFNVVVSSKPCL